MKVAYLLKKFPRLSETFILTELLTQERQGTEVFVFSRRAPDAEPRHADVELLRAPVEVLPRYGALTPWESLLTGAGMSLSGEDWFELQALALDLRGIVRDRLPRVVAEALYLRQRTLELGVDHVHVHFASESAVVAHVLWRLGGPSYSMTVHAKDIYSSNASAELVDRLIASSSFTVTVCDANVAYLAERVSSRARERLRRLYNGIDLDEFPFIQEGRAEGHILAVGRLVEKNGFDILIDALAELSETGRSFRATLVGAGQAERELRARAKLRGLSPGVLEFTGPLPLEEVRRLLARATVFCLPCLVGGDGNRDALPTVLLEALAAGLPCVSTPVAGIPEILHYGRVGRLVPERDARATAHELIALLDSSEERRHLASQGRRRAEELFDASQAGATLAAWFEEAGRYAEKAR